MIDCATVRMAIMLYRGQFAIGIQSSGFTPRPSATSDAEITRSTQGPTPHMATTAATSLVSLDDIASAADLLNGVAVRTPLLPCDALSAHSGHRTWLKPEMLQRGGAFKFRGAYTFLARLTEEERGRGVIAPSSGNHAQAVALAARLFGVPATVVMPTTVPTASARAPSDLGHGSSSPARRHSIGWSGRWSWWRSAA